MLKDRYRERAKEGERMEDGSTSAGRHSEDGERERETEVKGWGRAHGAVPSVCTAPCK